MLVLLATETDVFDASRGSVIVGLVVLQVLLIVYLPRSQPADCYWV